VRALDSVIVAASGRREVGGSKSLESRDFRDGLRSDDSRFGAKVGVSLEEAGSDEEGSL